MVASGPEKIFYSDEITELILKNSQREGREKRQEEQIKFTNKEKQVLRLIADGKTAAQIGEKTKIKSTTVESHKRNLFSKTECKGVKELVRFAILNGYHKKEKQ